MKTFKIWFSGSMTVIDDTEAEAIEQVYDALKGRGFDNYFIDSTDDEGDADDA